MAVGDGSVGEAAVNLVLGCSVGFVDGSMVIGSIATYKWGILGL